MLTHIAIVVQIDSDGTVHMVHLGGSGITNLYLNLDFPNQHQTSSGKVLNSFLRQNKPNEQSPRLAGELLKNVAPLWRLNR